MRTYVPGQHAVQLYSTFRTHYCHSPAQPCNRASWRRSWRSSWDTRLEWLGHLRLPCPLRPCLIKGGHDMCTRVPDVDALALKPWEHSGVHHWEDLGAKWAGVICRSRDGAKDERCARASANEVERDGR
jgi:hypothetical protein